MTTHDLLDLCRFTYLDIPDIYSDKLNRGESLPLADVAGSLLRLDALCALPCGRLSESKRVLLEKIRLLPLEIIACENRNSGSGFVAYAFKSAGGSLICVMRGSEGTGRCVPDNIDWKDNFCAPFYGSVQYAEAVHFADRFPSGELILTGHSKGAHNALYALGSAANPEACAIVFNGQGFARTQLDAAVRTRLRQHGINYVVADDIVGALLHHPEKRVFVRQADNGAHAHAPEAYLFDGSGEPIPGRRTARSRAVELFSQLFLHIHERDAPDWLLAVIRFMFGGTFACPTFATLSTNDA